jgi:predicted dienelactone hydrolase
MFGQDGLASVTVPVFIIGGTSDEFCNYDYDVAYFYETVGSSDRYLVSLKDASHRAVIQASDVIIHYATAFFGYYLQGKTDYTQYMTPESAEAFNDVTLEVIANE